MHHLQQRNVQGHALGVIQFPNAEGRTVNPCVEITDAAAKLFVKGS